MRSGLAGGALAAFALAAMLLGYGSVFTVYQTHQALVVRLGEPVRTVTEPGLHFKIPLIDSVISIDKRILDLTSPAQEVIASDQKRLIVDAFARYRIQEPLKFYQTVGTIQGLNSQLSTLLTSALRRVLGEASFIQAVRDERAHLMAQMHEQLDREAAAFGVSIVDVRITHVNLPEPNSLAIYRRMQTERQRKGAQIPRGRRPARAGDPRCRRSSSHRADRAGNFRGGTDPRRGRCRSQSDLCRRVQQRP